MKKTISLLLSLLMLAALFVPVSAADTVMSSEVLNSITEEEETGLGLAFLYTMNVQDLTIVGNRTFQSGKVTVDLESYNLVKMGAIVTNQAETGVDPNAMVIENVTGDRLKDVEAKKLFGWDDTQVQFAVRIINIPTTANKTLVYARPYYIYEDASGAQVTVYGAITSKNYYSGWCDANPVELPAVGTDIDVTKQKNRIRVYEASIVDRTVTLTFRNYTSNWITEETNYVKYTCYDAEGNSLEVGTIYIGVIDTKKNKTKSFTFDVPDATAKVALTSSSIVYWTEWS